ncbi:DUF3822 family protein [Dysgonomonas sp. 520]|uniref:DUF3822 family protein n=1 Tax=Dysgonomonas sp. 520 TaxID=2302931 RepID=UPI0013D53105|nr:DUF3822 family protein [Dysgonomonas sp. 520]NDW09150.1 DUF3822 family protein [Dysgonomonas sp. 520]
MDFPDNIDLTHPGKYILSIRIKRDGLSFIIFEPGVGSSYNYKEFPFSKDADLTASVQQIIFDNNYLTYMYKQVNVVYVTPLYDLVPEYLYEKNRKKELFDFVHYGNEGKVLTDEKTIDNNFLLYSFDEDVHKFMARSLFNPRFFHYTGILIPYFRDKARVVNSVSQIYINFCGGMTDVFCFSNSRLKHAVTYTDTNASDAVYYILNMWEKCGFDQLEDFLFLIGSSTDKFRIAADLTKYVKNVSMLGIPSEVQFLAEEARNTPLDLLLLSI